MAVMENDDYQKLRDYALKLLSFRPRSKKELSGKLTQYAVKKEFSNKFIEQVMTSLSDLNLVNDEEFARWWRDQRQGYKPKGRRVIELELKQKGISKEIISNVFAGQENSGQKEKELAFVSIRKKLPLYKNLPAIEIKKKLGNFLLRRGFTWEVTKCVIDSIGKKE